MAEGDGRNLETRLIEKVREVFPGYDDRIIRDGVYGALVAANGQNNDETVLLVRIIEALLMPAPVANAGKRQGNHGGTEVDDPKRARTSAGTGEDGNTSVNSSVSMDRSQMNESAGDSVGTSGEVSIDETVSADDALLIQTIQNHQRQEKLLAVFPWLDESWVAKQVERPDFNFDLLVEQILANPAVFPKKQKAKPQVKKEEPKDYLNSYLDLMPENLKETAVNYVMWRFRWLALSVIRSVVSYYNYHPAPAVHSLHEGTKNIDFRNQGGQQIPITLVRQGRANRLINMKIMKNPRFAIRPQIPDGLLEEINWIEKRCPIDETGKPIAQTDASTQQMNTSGVDEKELEEARQRGDLFECGVCFGEYDITRQMIQCYDGHLFCIDCMRQFAKEAIYGQNKTDLECMNDTCDARYPQDMIKKALDAETISKLEEKRMYESLNSVEIEGAERCKACNIPVVFDVPPTVDKQFRCPNPQCEIQYCRLCRVDWEEHFGKPCKEVETEDDTRRRREAEERMADAVIRKCSNCKAPLIKAEGCNKVACSCGCLMCYICKQTIRGYDHFCQHVRNPGQRCGSCTKCCLWEDPNVRDTAAVNQIRDEANRQIAETGKQLKVGTDVQVAVATNTQPRAPMVQPQVNPGQHRMVGPARAAAQGPVQRPPYYVYQPAVPIAVGAPPPIPAPAPARFAPPPPPQPAAAAHIGAVVNAVAGHHAAYGHAPVQQHQQHQNNARAGARRGGRQ